MTTDAGSESVQMLRTMLLIRRFDEAALDLIARGRIYGVVHPYIGQEAVAVGVCSVLRTSDTVTTYHRGHGHSIAKGASVPRMMAELFGRVDGCCAGKGGSMHIADFGCGMLGVNGIVGAGIPHALGSAFAFRLRSADGVAVCFFGDGATGQGILYECMNIAALNALPVVFVCDNNQYSGPSRVNEVLASAEVAHLSAPFNFPGYTVDGTDAREVRRAASRAVDRARRGDGPTLLDCKSYRWGVHAERTSGVTDPRPRLEVESATANDPIEKLRVQLSEAGVLTDPTYAEIVNGVESDIRDAVDFAERSPFPLAASAFTDVYGAGIQG